MSTIERGFIALPTHQAELAKRGGPLGNASMIETLSVYTSHTAERLKIDKQSAIPLIVRLAEMDSIAGLEIIGDNVDLLLDVVSNERVILKNHEVVKRLVAQSKQVAKDHSIAPSDMRLQKIEAIEKKMGAISEKGYEALPFHQEFPQLSLQDQVMIGELDGGVYKELLRKRRLKAPVPRVLTLEDETHQYLRMYLMQSQGKKTVIDAEYQVKMLSKIWEEKLYRALHVLYPQSQIVIRNGQVTVDEAEISEKLCTLDIVDQTIIQIVQEVESKENNPKLRERMKDKFLRHHAVNMYNSGNKNWEKIIDEISDEQVKEKVLTDILLSAYDNNDIPVFNELFNNMDMCSDLTFCRLAIRAYEKKDERYSIWLGQMGSRTTELEEASKAIAIKAFEMKDTNFRSVFNNISTEGGRVVVLVECTVSAYQRGDSSLYKKLLEETKTIAYEPEIDNMIARIVAIDYVKGKSVSTFLKRNKNNSRLLSQFWLEVAEHEYATGGDFHASLSQSPDSMQYKLLEKIIISSYKADNTQTFNTMIKQYNKALKDFGFADLLHSFLWSQLANIAFEKNDLFYLECLKNIPEKDYEIETIVELKAKHHLATNAYTAYMFYSLTHSLEAEKISHYFNSLPVKPYQPHNMSDIHARMANKILHDNPEQFIESMSGVSYSSSEFSADTLVKNIFEKELFAHLSEKDRSWARSGYDSSLLDKSLPDVSAENYLMYSDSGSLEGGDPRGQPHPVVRTNIPLGHFLTTRRLANINEYGTGEATPIIFDPSIKDKVGAQYTVSYIPRLKKGKISLAVSPNSAIQGLCIDHAVQDIPSNNHYEITSDGVEISYSAIKNSFPDMPLVSYAPEVVLSEELRKVKLPYELEALVENMREQPLTHQLLMIQELRDTYFIYDLDNKRVASLKAGRTLRERLVVMRKRAGEIKKENPDSKTFESIRWAGVCSDITFVSATLLAKLNVPFYIDVGFLVNGPVVTTQEAHSQIIIPLADEEGTRHDLEFDPTNGIVRIGNVKITPEQLREIIPLDNPTQPASIDPKKTGKREFFSYQSLRHLTLEQRKNYKEQELYTKIAAVGESLGGSSVLRGDEKWSPSVINRLDSIQRYFLSQIVKDVQMTHPDGAQDIITYTLSYIRKRGGTISREELKQIILNDKNLSFLIE